jgi:hypothetical protein
MISREGPIKASLALSVDLFSLRLEMQSIMCALTSNPSLSRAKSVENPLLSKVISKDIRSSLAWLSKIKRSLRTKKCESVPQSFSIEVQMNTDLKFATITPESGIPNFQNLP